MRVGIHVALQDAVLRCRRLAGAGQEAGGAREKRMGGMTVCRGPARVQIMYYEAYGEGNGRAMV